MTTKITFRLNSSILGEAGQAMLLGEFNNWNIDEGIMLQKKEDGSMAAELVLTAGRTYQYRYLLSDGRWVNDDNAVMYTRIDGGIVENCVINVPAQPTGTRINSGKKAQRKVPAVRNDNLLKISGIDEEVSRWLNNLGITSYKALAKLTIRKLKQMVHESGGTMKDEDITSWPKQARLAAAGKWNELLELQQAPAKKSKSK